MCIVSFLFFSSVHPSILLWSVTVTVRCIVNHLLLSLAGRVFVHRVFISTILIFIYFTITVLSFNSCHHHDILWFVDLVGTQHIQLIAHTGNETIAVLAIVCLQLRLEMILWCCCLCCELFVCTVAVNNLTNKSTFSTTITYVLFVASTVCEWDDTVVRLTDDNSTK